MATETPTSVTRDEQVGKATSASPALSALQRAISDRKGYAVQRSLDAITAQQAKDAHYIAPDGSRLRDVKDAGMGKPMFGTEVQRRLQTINPSLIFEDSPYVGRICINVMLQDETLGRVKHNICSMERGLMPEFSVLNVVEESMMSKETGQIETLRKINERNPEQRGWRTVLAKLIRAGHLGQAAAELAFGTPTRDSKKWQDALCH